jgi:ribosome hibernation promoting factor
MRLELTGRHVDITPSVRRVIDGKLARLERLLNDSAVSAQVVLSREKYGNRADVTLHARGEKFLHGIGKGTSLQISMGQAIEKIIQQAQKVKGKWQERKRHGGVKGSPIVGEQPQAVAVRPAAAAVRRAVRMPRILRASRQTIKAMSVADAAREIDGGSGIVVFRDAETAGIAVLYRTPAGELTLVETEV